jgi:uncharacterized membrane protein
MTTAPSTLAPIEFAAPRIRRIGQDDLNWALAQGWSDFKDRRGDMIVLALIYPIVGLVAAALAFNARLLPMIFPLVAGLSILGPAVASGFYELARRREAGLETSWIHFLDPLRERSRLPLAMLTAGLAVLFLAWLAVASLIYTVTLGAAGTQSTADFFDRLFTTPQGWTMIVLGNLAGLAFAAVTLGLTLISFPLVVDEPVDAVTAVESSIRAVRENPGVTASWGLRVAGLLALGCLPLFVGLAVILPVLGYATWHLYTRLVDRRR